MKNNATRIKTPAGSYFDLATQTYHQGLDLARKGANAIRGGFARGAMFLAALALVLFAGAPVAKAELPSIVTYTESTGAVAFTPGAAITPVIVGVIAAVAAGVGLFVIVVGVRKIFGMLKRMG